MNDRPEDRKTRAVEATIEVDAPVEAVWDALTDARELRRWFPFEARVTPGKGGKIWISWGKDWEMESGIEIWEPGRHLRTVSEQPAPEAGKGSEETLKWASADASADARSRAVRIAVDYHLEGKGGKTVLRLVQSGFGQGSEWDDEYDEVGRGWLVELRNLRHYLERHAGRDRRVAWARRACPGPAEKAWETLVSPGGLLASGSLDGLSEGDPYRIETTPGEVLEGTTLVADPPHGFLGTVENMGGAVFRIMILEYYGRYEASLWLARWEEGEGSTEDLQSRWGSFLERLYGSA